MAADTTAQLAEFVASVDHHALPEDVRTVARLVLLDALGAAAAGAAVLDQDAARLRAAAHGLGPGRSSAVGAGGGWSAEAAAFLNGGLFHALNLDAVGPGMSHLGVCTPAALALGEERDAGIGELVGAVAVGVELAARLAVVSADPQGRHGWLGGQVLSYLAATAAAARIAGLDAPGVHSAFGTAFMQTAGTMEIMQGGDRPVKAFYGSFPNLAAVIAVRMSAAGLDARCRAVEGELGVLRQFYAVEEAAPLLDGLGERFVALDALFKRWPVSAFIHPYVAAVLDLDVADPDEVGRLVLRVPPGLKGYAEPLDVRLRPSSAAEAGNSLPYCAARALSDGRLALEHFTAGELDAWSRGPGRAAQRRIEVRTPGPGEVPGVEAHAGGDVLDVPLASAEAGLARGAGARGLVEEKFRATLAWCGFDEERTRALQALVTTGEDQPLRALTSLAATP